MLAGGTMPDKKESQADTGRQAQAHGWAEPSTGTRAL